MKPTLNDRLLVQVMTSQAMNGVITPDVTAATVCENGERWDLKFYLKGPICEEVQQDLVEVGGDASSMLDCQYPSEIKHTDAIYWPFEVELIVDPEHSALRAAVKENAMLIVVFSVYISGGSLR